MLSNEDNLIHFIYLLGAVALLGAGVFTRLRYDTHRTLAQIATWVVIFCVIILGYSFRHEFGSLGARFSGELMPRDGRIEGERSMSYPAASSGHFEVTAQADAIDLDFLVDTGASNVVLSPDAAQRLGYDLSKLAFTRIAETANGQVRGAPIVISEFRLGNIVIHDLPATVNGADMPHSLLGMDFLRRLRAWHVADDRLTLEQ